MPGLTRQTVSIREADIKRAWYIVDAADKIVGRLATEVAEILRGKHRPYYTPHVDCGDHVIIINASQMRLTGNKADEKFYYRHTGYLGGLRKKVAGEELVNNPEFVLMNAVRGMLPKNRLGRQMLTKLRVYGGGDHPHEAQQPQPLTLSQ